MEIRLPLIPPNCPQFINTTDGRLVFSCFKHHVDPNTWSHDEDFPWVLNGEEDIKDYQKPIIAAVAYLAWNDEYKRLCNSSDGYESEDDCDKRTLEIAIAAETAVEWLKWRSKYEC